MESLVPFQASYSMADLIKDWDQALGELQHGDEVMPCGAPVPNSHCINSHL